MADIREFKPRQKKGPVKDDDGRFRLGKQYFIANIEGDGPEVLTVSYVGRSADGSAYMFSTPPDERGMAYIFGSPDGSELHDTEEDAKKEYDQYFFDLESRLSFFPGEVLKFAFSAAMLALAGKRRELLRHAIAKDFPTVNEAMEKEGIYDEARLF